jgi:hypothetical protein
MRTVLLAIAAAAVLTSPAIADPAPTTAPAGVAAFIRHHLGSSDEARYATAQVDLNGDGHPETVAFVMGSTICGSAGCTLLVLTPSGSTWRILADTTVTQQPIRVLATRSHGYRDLAVGVSGGGGRDGMARLRFTGVHYPSNPTLAPAVPAGPGDILIADGAEGVPLP